MKIQQHNFDLADLLTPLVNQGVNTVQSAQTSIDLINKDVTFLNKYWPEIAVAVFVAFIVAGIVSNAVNG